MIATNYAIETKGLIKRYPTATRREGGGYGRGFGGSVSSFGNIFGVLKRKKGSYIEALRGIDLQVKKGEVFGLLGPNGAGKTTLIKVLCTLVIHDEGSAYVNGIDVKKEPGKVLKDLQAVLPESRGFTWRLSGRQNLAFYALLYGLRDREAEERINYLLELTGLKDRADDGYQRYSTGMQRKLLLCRALLRETQVLLFDEPTVGLDPTSAMEFRHLLRDRLAHEEGKTIVLSTHNLPEAQDICDRIAILDRGKISMCDTPEHIRYTMSDEKILTIILVDAEYNVKQETMLNTLEKIPGVHGVTPELDIDKKLARLSIRVQKDLILSTILEVLAGYQLQINGITTQEPTFEDAFTAITRRRREE
ncbi:MAG TPA: ABC transporter ATP-binding protein [Dehalococcoidia bacterium]|nr:ABC transporter ATP-binding protein [Dehalococcoidia bacterium]